MKTHQNINISVNDLLGGVATYNADPFCIETPEQAQEVYNDLGDVFEEIIDPEFFELAVRQLDLTKLNPKHIYTNGIVTVCLAQDFD